MKNTIAEVVCKDEMQAEKARKNIRKQFAYEKEVPEVEDENRIIRSRYFFKIRLPGRGPERRVIMSRVLNIVQRLEVIERWKYTTV